MTSTALLDQSKRRWLYWYPTPAVVSFLRLAAAVAFTVTLTHYRVVFGGDTYVDRDALRFLLPARRALADALSRGRVPEWFDGVNFGQAFAANPLNLPLSPVGWPFAFFTSTSAFDLHTLLLIAVAGIGTALFARRLGADEAGATLAGCALSISGYVSSVIVNGFAPVVAWAPWIAWAADHVVQERAIAGRSFKWTVAMATAIALQLSVGEPASVWVAFIIVISIVIARSNRGAAVWINSAIAGILSLGLAAVALVPGALLLRDSARHAKIAGDPAGWSMHPARLIETIWPAAFGGEASDSWLAGPLLKRSAGDPFWSFTLFIGAPILVLAFLAMREKGSRWMAVTTALFVCLAMGPLTPIYRIAAGILRESIGNFPEKFIYGAIILTCAAAGVGFTRARREVTTVSVTIAIFLFGSAAVVWLMRPAISSIVSASHAVTNVGEGLRLSVMGAVVGATSSVAFAVAMRRSKRSVAAAAVLLPLAWSAHVTLAAAPRAASETRPSILRDLPRPSDGSPRPRLYVVPSFASSSVPATSGSAMRNSISENLETNTASLYDLNVIPGFDPAETARSRDFWLRCAPRMSLDSFVSLLGIDYIAANGRLVPTRGGRPRAFVSPRWFAVSSDPEARGLLCAPGRDNDSALVVVAGHETGGFRDAPLSPCNIIVARPEEIHLDCSSATGGLAVMLDEAARGWKATVDNQPVEIIAADGLFRAVPVQAGRHAIRFDYETPGLHLGAVVSLISSVSAALMLVASRGQRSRPVAQW